MPHGNAATAPHLLRRLAVILTATLLAALLPLAGGVAQADYDITDYPGVTGSIVERTGDDLVPSYRYRGANRFDTAHLIAEDTDTLQADPSDTFATSDTVLVARADFFPDALSGAYLAGLVRAPLLLVSTSGAIEPHTLEALETIDPDEVIILGGLDAVSQQVEDDLDADYEVSRVRGPDRFATAAAIAEQGADTLPDDEARTAIVASGEEFPDALVSGALSYAANLPLLLTGAGVLPGVTADALTDLEIDEVLLLGGTGRIHAAVEAEIAALGIDVERVFGPTRVGTAAELAELAIERYGFTTSHVNFARGDAFPDALAMGPHAGEEQAPLLLTVSPDRFDDLAGSNAGTLADAGCELGVLHLAGGPAAISTDVEQEIRTAATRSGEVCDFTLDPADGVNPIGEDHTLTAAVTDNAGTGVPGGSVTFTVSVDEGSTATPSVEEDTVPVDDDGRAVFTFDSPTPGAVTITACLDDTDWCATATKVFVDFDAFVEAITIEALMDHLSALQDCADESVTGDRETSSPGYECSVDYVRDTLIAAGYPAEDIEELFFDFTLWETAEPGTLTVGDTTYTTGDEDGPIAFMSYSGSTDGEPVSGPLLGVTNNVVPMPADAPPSTSEAGCEPEDFDDRDFEGAIAVVQRGFCDFRVKAENAAAAGAVGVIIFNEGQPGRDDLLLGTLSDDYTARDVPVFGTTYDLGVDLLELEGQTATMQTDTSFEESSSSNLVLRIPGSAPRGAIMSGAHLDSVHDAAGINDNGSGSVGILEIALQMAELDIQPRNDTYFAWWGAEEHGLIGSTCFVEGGCGGDLEAGRVVDFTLEEPDYTDLGYQLLEGGYLNYDMIASPNYIRGIYDGDGATLGIEGPEGSAQIEATYQAFFDARDLPHQATDFSGRSDYVGFTNYGIAAGGLFTGAEDVKTEEEEELYGGEAGESYDPCYHQPCDSMFDGWPTGDGPNIAEDVFIQNVGAAANSALLFSMTLDPLREPVGGDDDDDGAEARGFTRAAAASTHHHAGR